jgi:Family of unknown function (DUF6632)
MRAPVAMQPLSPTMDRHINLPRWITAVVRQELAFGPRDEPAAWNSVLRLLANRRRLLMCHSQNLSFRVPWRRRYDYLQLICGIYAVLGAYLIVAARKPSEYRSPISFTIWSTLVHAGSMAAQSIYTRSVTLSEICPHSCWLSPCFGFYCRRKTRAGHSKATACRPIMAFLLAF